MEHLRRLRTQQVRSIIGILLLGSVSLGAILFIFEAAELENPLAEAFEKRTHLPTN